MSLINDALKRAKAAQQTNPASTAPDLPLRPVETVQHSRQRTALLLPMICGVALALVAVLLWQGSQRRVTPPQTAPAIVQTASPAETTPAAVAPPPPAVPAIQIEIASQPVPLPATSLPTAVAPVVVTPPAPVNSTVSTEPPPAAPSPDSTAVPATVVAAPPPPAPLKLQGILYRRTNPVAIINGKTVGVGDRVGEATVAAIHPDSTVVVVAGESIKLSLPQ